MDQLCNRLRLAFYTASDGPRLVLFGPLGTDLAPLECLFRNMIRSKDGDRIDTQPFVAAFGGVEILATRTGSMNNAKGLRQIDADQPRFEWQCTGDEWDRLSELVSSVNQTNAPCHQYLTQYPEDDATVVISKGEYSEGILGDVPENAICEQRTIEELGPMGGSEIRDSPNNAANERVERAREWIKKMEAQLPALRRIEKNLATQFEKKCAIDLIEIDGDGANKLRMFVFFKTDSDLEACRNVGIVQEMIDAVYAEAKTEGIGKSGEITINCEFDSTERVKAIFGNSYQLRMD